MQPVVEDGLTLDLARLRRHGLLAPGRGTGGVIRWTNTRTGERVSSIGYLSDLSDPADPWLRLHYTTTKWDGTKLHHDYRVSLAAKVPHFGGVRWWFVCPLTNSLAAKLYLPPGADRFASRRAFRMAYRSQRRDRLGAIQARQAKVVRKLAGEYEHPDPPPPRRPKWMRHATYERLCAELERGGDAHYRASLDAALRLLPRLTSSSTSHAAALIALAGLDKDAVVGHPASASRRRGRSKKRPPASASSGAE